MTRTFRSRGAASVVTLCGLLALGAWPVRPVRAAGELEGLALIEAIAVLERRGLTVFYSSDLVRPDMRVREPVQIGKPLAELRELLAPFGLTVRAGPGGSWLVVSDHRAGPESRAARPQASPAPVPRRPALEEVVVTTSRYELDGGAAAARTLTSGDLEYLPSVGDDALRAVARLPGTAANGLSARSHVRGGEVEETLVRFDQLRLYSPFHLRDFQSVFSTVDPRLVRSIDVYTGGFPAPFGDRMSGVLDVSSLGVPAEAYREVALSFFNLSALASGRFAEGRAGWLASARRGNLDWLYSTFSEQPQRPRYRDGFARLEYQVRDSLRLSGNALYFKDDVVLVDDLDLEEQAFANTRDRYVWLRLDQQPGPRLTGATLLSQADLRSDRQGETAKEGVSRGRLSDVRHLRVSSAQSTWSWQPGDRLGVQFGATAVRASGSYVYSDDVRFDALVDTPGAPSTTARARSLSLEHTGHQYGLYGSARYGVTERLALDLGLRWDRTTLTSGREHTFDPRLAVRYRLGAGTLVRTSWGRFHQSQAIDELQVSDGVTVFFPPQRAEHAVISVEHAFANGIDIRIEAYDKGMRSLRPRYENVLNPLTLLPELKPDRARLAPVEAHARGLEISVGRRRHEILTWSLAYSRARVRDLFADGWVLRSWDQTDALQAELVWTVGQWTVGAALVHRSGWPTTPAELDAVDAEPPVIRTGERNSERVDFFRSLDVRVSRDVAVRHGNLSLFGELSNILGRRNPCCFEYEVEFDDDRAAELDLSAIPYPSTVPSLGFVWSF